MDEPMKLDDFDAYCEEEDEERGSAWVEPPEELPQQHDQLPPQQQQQQQPAGGGSQAEEAKEATAHPPAVPSVLNAYWVRYLLRNGLSGAATSKAQFGI